MKPGLICVRSNGFSRPKTAKAVTTSPIFDLLRLGIYVHTHWGYHHPYAARAWTLADWEGYVAGLHALGYDFLMIWPLLDSMPPSPTPSDRAFLTIVAQAIDLAHERFGMRVAVVACPNTIGNARASAYPFQTRPYFTCERKVDPGDAVEVAAFLEGRRNQFALLRSADALAIIDSDPGGYVGSTDAEFVALMRGQIEVFRTFNPEAELLYWMLVGWENYNRFWADAQRWQPGDPEPRIAARPEVFTETLEMMRIQIAEPWGLLSSRGEHVDVIASLGLEDKTLAFPYGVVEGEPTVPLTLFDIDRVDNGVHSPLARQAGRGVMANAQTHCLQLPHIYLFAHFARGGTRQTIDLEGFAERLLPGQGAMVAQAWSALAGGDPEAQRAAAARVAEGVGRASTSGELAGLLFGDANRFLTDLAMNLRVRAGLADFDAAVESGGGIPHSLRQLLDVLRPYQQRLGYVDAYVGLLMAQFNGPLARLGDASIDRMLTEFHDWRTPSVRQGILDRLLEAVEAYCQQHDV